MKRRILVFNKIHEYLEESWSIYFAFHYSGNTNRLSNIVEKVLYFHEFFIQKGLSKCSFFFYFIINFRTKNSKKLHKFFIIMSNLSHIACILKKSQMVLQN